MTLPAKTVVSNNLTILLFGPTGCLSGDTRLTVMHGTHLRRFTLKELYHKFHGGSLKGRTWDTNLPTRISSYNGGTTITRLIADVTYSGVRPTYVLEVEGKPAIRGTADHRFLTPDGFKRLDALTEGDSVIVSALKVAGKGRTVRHNRQTVKARFHPRARIKVIKGIDYTELPLHWAVVDAHLNKMPLEDFLYVINNDEEKSMMLEFIDEGLVVHHKNENPSDNRIDNLQIMTKLEHDTHHGKRNYVNWGHSNTTTARVLSITPYEEEETYDITMEDEAHPNFLANGIIVHNSGKTAQIGELAEYLYRTKKLRTRLYASDRGGWDTIRPHTELEVSPGKPLIEVIPMFDDPFFWVDHAVRGDKWVSSPDGKQGKWVPGVDPDIGLYAFEGMTSMADAEMTWMADASSKGINIGGGGAFNFKVKNGNDTMNIGSNNQAHYGVAQQQVFDKSTQSMYLPGIVLWTAGDRRSDDDANGGVVGPQTAGKAQASEVPRWFKYTFRIGIETMAGMPTKHVLYTDRHVELQSKGLAQGISNSRVPLSGTSVAIPSKIEPASLVAVMQLLEKRQIAAKDEIKLRLGLT